MEKLIICAAYVRMSTDEQNFSISHQIAEISQYAREHALCVERTYIDEGRSGLTLNGRNGLTRLIDDIQSGRNEFSVVLVYDVSRWGRFQDVDESAHYEYLCRRAGVQVRYCAEQFENDGSPISSLMKGVKRMMAAEYSRELSKKVLHAQRRFAALGYKLGGMAGYGLRRVSLNRHGEVTRELKYGERKSAPNERVTFRLGPDNEVKVVRRIYDLYLRQGWGDLQIARQLNDEGIPNELGYQWRAWHVRSILTNEKYVGNIVFNRRNARLKQRRTLNHPDLWIRVENAFPAIVSARKFARAQKERVERMTPWGREELLRGISRVAEIHGRVSAPLLAMHGYPNAKVFLNHFKSMSLAYALAGHPQLQASRCRETNGAGNRARHQLLNAVADAIRITGHGACVDQHHRVISLDNGIQVRLEAVCCRAKEGRNYWTFPFRSASRADFLIAAQLQPGNEKVSAYYLLPRSRLLMGGGRYTQTEPADLAQFRHPDIPSLFGLNSKTGGQ